jgi:hypothetical protein
METSEPLSALLVGTLLLLVAALARRSPAHKNKTAGLHQ